MLIMAITQQNIINEIPSIITVNSNEIVLKLRTLVDFGWGNKCELYKKLSELWEEIHNLERGESHVLGKFDRKTFIISDFDCRKCLDSGTVFNDKYEDIPCSCARGRRL